jgi:hypothetical protein
MSFLPDRGRQSFSYRDPGLRERAATSGNSRAGGAVSRTLPAAGREDEDQCCNLGDLELNTAAP